MSSKVPIPEGKKSGKTAEGKMPVVQPRVIGIFLADLHWSEKAPISRSAEPDWMEVQKEQMRQLRDLQIHLGKPPIFVAGDLFHKWNSPPILISNVLSW